MKANEPWPKMMAETAQMHRFKKVLAMMKVEVGLTLLLEVVGSAKSSSPQPHSSLWSFYFLLVEFSTSALNAEMSKCISRSFICVDLYNIRLQLHLHSGCLHAVGGTDCADKR